MADEHPKPGCIGWFMLVFLFGMILFGIGALVVQLIAALV